MPDEKTLERARRDLREGKSPGTAAGEFVREEMHHLRDGTHGVSSPEQAIAIGLSKARRAGILPGEEPPRRAKTRRPASPDEDAASPAPDATSRAKRALILLARPTMAVCSWVSTGALAGDASTSSSTPGALPMARSTPVLTIMSPMRSGR
jgi:hypothetical protein